MTFVMIMDDMMDNTSDDMPAGDAPAEDGDTPTDEGGDMPADDASSEDGDDMTSDENGDGDDAAM